MMDITGTQRLMVTARCRAQPKREANDIAAQAPSSPRDLRDDIILLPRAVRETDAFLPCARSC
jgi:hypothetical protein